MTVPLSVRGSAVYPTLPIRVTGSPLYDNLIFVTDNTAETPATGFSPAVHFGKQVRKARRRKGWSIHELAAQSGISAGHLSHIENGNKPPTEKIAMAMDRVFPERQGWFTDYQRDAQGWTKPGYRTWSIHERGAKQIRAWMPGVLHGLVQTEAYARVMQGLGLDVTPEAVDSRTAAQMERQDCIFRRDDPPSMWVVVDELCVYRRVGTAQDMAVQMGHLVEVAQLPHVTMQVLPAEAQPGYASELIVADNAAYTEHLAGGVMHTDADTVSELARLFNTMQAECMRASESIEFFGRMREAWARGGNPLTPAREDRASK